MPPERHHTAQLPTQTAKSWVHRVYGYVLLTSGTVTRFAFAAFFAACRASHFSCIALKSGTPLPPPRGVLRLFGDCWELPGLPFLPDRSLPPLPNCPEASLPRAWLCRLLRAPEQPASLAPDAPPSVE